MREARPSAGLHKAVFYHGFPAVTTVFSKSSLLLYRGFTACSHFRDSKNLWLRSQLPDSHKNKECFLLNIIPVFSKFFVKTQEKA